MASAEPEQRRRAEQLRAVETAAQLDERALDGRRIGAGDDDPDEVAERRVAELAPTVELAGEKPRDVVARGQLDRASVGLEGLDQARGPARRGRCGRRAG